MLPFFIITDIENKICFLSETNSRHAIKVLRMKNNDELTVINGFGLYGLAEIIDANPKKTKIKIGRIRQEKKPVHLGLAFCPTKSNDRNGLIIEKATEIGVTDFYPLTSQNSERRKWNFEKFNKVLVSAVKQSQQFWTPKIHEIQNYYNFISSNLGIDLKFLAHCKELKKNKIKELSNPMKSQLIVVGPEGDFTLEELKLADENNFKMISLGQNRLRTETACIVGISIMKL